jgi:O-antigen ligase
MTEVFDSIDRRVRALAGHVIWRDVAISGSCAVAGALSVWLLSRSLLGAALGLMCGACLVYIVREPRVGLATILLTLPLDRYGTLVERPVAITAYHVVLLATLASWGWRIIRRGEGVRWSAVDVGMATLVFAAAWSLPLSLARGATFVATLRVAFSAAFVLLFSNLAVDPRWLRRLTIVFAFSAIASAIIAIAQYLVPGLPITMLNMSAVGDGTVVWRASGLFHDPNYLGAFLAAAVVAFAAAAVHASRRQNSAAWTAAVAVCAAALLLTLSRGSWIAAAVGLAVVALTAPPRWWAALAVTGLVIVVALAVLAPASVRERALSSFDIGKDPSAATRWHMLGSAASMARDHWLFGVGLAAFDQAYPRYRVAGTIAGVARPHEVPLALVAETGIPGLVAQVAIIVGIVTELRRRRGAVRTAYGSAAAATLAAFAAGVFFEYFLYFECLWLCVALAVVAGRLRDNEEPAVA